MRVLKNDTADFSIEIKNLDNLYIAKVTESHIRFVYDGKRYILSKDDSDDEFMTLYKVVSKDTLREISTQITSLDICLLVSYFVIPSFTASSATAFATTFATLSSNAPGMM